MDAIPAGTPPRKTPRLTRAMDFLASKGVTAVASVSAGWDQVAAVKRARRERRA